MYMIFSNFFFNQMIEFKQLVNMGIYSFFHILFVNYFGIIKYILVEQTIKK